VLACLPAWRGRPVRNQRRSCRGQARPPEVCGWSGNPRGLCWQVAWPNSRAKGGGMLWGALQARMGRSVASRLRDVCVAPRPRLHHLTSWLPLRPACGLSCLAPWIAEKAVGAALPCFSCVRWLRWQLTRTLTTVRSAPGAPQITRYWHEDGAKQNHIMQSLRAMSMAPMRAYAVLLVARRRRVLTRAPATYRHPLPLLQGNGTLRWRLGVE
jgi:hypothetical protein